MKLKLALFVLLFGTLIAHSQEQYKIIVDGKEVMVNASDNINQIIAKADLNNNPDVNMHVHTVKYGETLFSISRLYNLTVNELCRLNRIDRLQVIQIGKELKVTNFTKTKTNVNNASYHIVTKGDTLYAIARRYGITVNTLKQLNDLDSNEILINQKLRLN